MNKIFEPVKLKNLTVKNRLVRSATWEGFRSADKIEEVLNHTNIKMISLSRPLLCEPDWPNKIFEDAGALSKCVSCNACYSSPAHKCIFKERDLL